MITFKDFKKLDLRIATIKSALEIKGADKLLKLILDLGDGEERQIIAGIKQYYNKDDLIGKQIVIVANLEPKEFKGEISQGMLLAADADGEPVLLGVDKKVPNGSKIH